MSTEPESPYLLPPGPERRSMMRTMGILVCALDYSDDEWEAAEATARGTGEPPQTGSGEGDDIARLG